MHKDVPRTFATSTPVPISKRSRDFSRSGNLEGSDIGIDIPRTPSNTMKPQNRNKRTYRKLSCQLLRSRRPASRSVKLRKQDGASIHLRSKREWPHALFELDSALELELRINAKSVITLLVAALCFPTSPSWLTLASSYSTFAPNNNSNNHQKSHTTISASNLHKLNRQVTQEQAPPD